MDGKKRKQNSNSSSNRKTNNPQTNMKALKKDIESLESQVSMLLENVHVVSIGLVCSMCDKRIDTLEYHELPCQQHVVCATCADDRISTTHKPIGCPQCAPTQQYHPFYHHHDDAPSTDTSNSSSSSEN